MQLSKTCFELSFLGKNIGDTCDTCRSYIHNNDRQVMGKVYVDRKPDQRLVILGTRRRGLPGVVLGSHVLAIVD